MRARVASGKNAGAARFPDRNGIKTGSAQTPAIRRVTLGSALLFMFALLYVPSLANWLSGSRVTVDILRYGIMEEYVRCNAIIIRDEILLEPSPISGKCLPEIGEGEKASAFSTVALIMNEKSEEMVREIEDINAKIVKARMEKAEKEKFFSEDIARLDDEISLKVRNLIEACNSSHYGEIGKCRVEIGKIIEKKAEIAGENLTDSYISSLAKRKEDIQKEINANTVQIKTVVSGIVSYAIDGLETYLTPKTAGSITPGMLDETASRHSRGKPSAGRAQAGVPAAKIIKGIDILVAAAMPAEKTEGINEGDRIKLRINDAGMETVGEIIHKSNIAGGRAAIVAKIGRGTDVLSSRRFISVDFIKRTEEGFKVHAKSLVDISPDGKSASIMLVKYNAATARKVDIACMDGEYAIIRPVESGTDKVGGIKSMNLYDTYIVNPKNVEEGDMISK